MTIREFMQRHYRHFNAAVCVEAADAWIAHLEQGGKMFLTLAGAMSTAEMGISVAELIRQDKVHGICCTGANLEEDIFNLVAHSHYERVPDYRSLSAEEEVSLRERGLNRVTDTCIPEDTAIRRIEEHMLALWRKADRAGESYFPYEFFYQLLDSGVLAGSYEIDPADSWMVAAHAKRLPIWTPGWEDSTLANIFTSHVIRGTVSRPGVVRSGIETDAGAGALVSGDDGVLLSGLFSGRRRHCGRFPHLRRPAHRTGPGTGLPPLGLLCPDRR